jgi:hypothetical protein
MSDADLNLNDKILNNTTVDCNGIKLKFLYLHLIIKLKNFPISKIRRAENDESGLHHRLNGVPCRMRCPARRALARLEGLIAGRRSPQASCIHHHHQRRVLFGTKRDARYSIHVLYIRLALSYSTILFYVLLSPFQSSE